MEDLFYQLGKKNHFVTLEVEILLIVRRLFVLLLLIIVDLFFFPVRYAALSPF